MYCRQCGAPLPEDALFCSRCGFHLAAPSGTQPTPAVQPEAVDQPAAQDVMQPPTEPSPICEQPEDQAPAPAVYQEAYPAQPYPPQAPFVSEEQKAESNSVFVWGIIGLAFSSSFFLSFLGIIFSAVAKKKAKDYIARWGTVYGKAKVGNILSTIGIPVGIVLTVLCILYLILYVSFFVALFSGALNNF